MYVEAVDHNRRRATGSVVLQARDRRDGLRAVRQIEAGRDGASSSVSVLWSAQSVQLPEAILQRGFLWRGRWFAALLTRWVALIEVFEIRWFRGSAVDPNRPRATESVAPTSCHRRDGLGAVRQIKDGRDGTRPSVSRSAFSLPRWPTVLR